MILEKTKVKVKCDSPGCKNLAEYSLVEKKFFLSSSRHFCKKCLAEINAEISKIITPKSPKNVLTKPKSKIKREVKK